MVRNHWGSRAERPRILTSCGTARSLAPRLSEGDESNAPGDLLPTFYATFYHADEVVSSVPPVPPAIWADWNKDDTLLGGGSLPHVTLLGNCAQEQHRRIRNPLPANEQRPSEVLRGMLPQHAAHGRACGNLRHTPTLPTSTTSYYATLLRGQQRFQWLRQFCQIGER